jgi:hypothetical protein
MTTMARPKFCPVRSVIFTGCFSGERRKLFQNAQPTGEGGKIRNPTLTRLWRGTLRDLLLRYGQYQASQAGRLRCLRLTRTAYQWRNLTPRAKKSAPLPPPASNDNIGESVEPAAKRQKRISVHPTLWDAHGNSMVIVQMEDVQFSLHRSWLAKHSNFFSSLFNGEDLSGDGARVERIEGGEVYIISNTKATDFSALLSAVDNAM